MTDEWPGQRAAGRNNVGQLENLLGVRGFRGQAPNLKPASSLLRMGLFGAITMISPGPLVSAWPRRMRALEGGLVDHAVHTSFIAVRLRMSVTQI